MSLLSAANATTDAAGENLPALARLKLSADDLEALGRRGTVSEEFRGDRGPYFRLRFRKDGRQHARYVGQDPQHAKQVRGELELLQNGRRLNRELGHLHREARCVLKQTREQIQPHAARVGARFHGLHIRDRSPTKRDKRLAIDSTTATATTTTRLVIMSEIPHDPSNSEFREHQPAASASSNAGVQNADFLRSTLSPPARPAAADPMERDPFGKDFMAVAGTLTDILKRLGPKIQTALDSDLAEVRHYGRLPAAVNDYQGLLRQYSSLGNLKIQLEKQHRPFA